ncbi:hypothetical protein [Aquimarina sp. 2201CG5-10]|uniref:hypothetical protein n=1 Tax=Aquimarina callyspongiae TaxID=3098150 RepID=UPI002AB518CA|nr:hypothetical protein [Aquimarina sp. 2201CG5-10]MDY8136181.1 hypothetical protein [Aquimarina sp. 2201CG5-10]
MITKKFLLIAFIFGYTVIGFGQDETAKTDENKKIEKPKKVTAKDEKNSKAVILTKNNTKNNIKKGVELTQLKDPKKNSAISQKDEGVKTEGENLKNNNETEKKVSTVKKANRSKKKSIKKKN